MGLVPGACNRNRPRGLDAESAESRGQGKIWADARREVSAGGWAQPPAETSRLASAQIFPWPRAAWLGAAAFFFALPAWRITLLVLPLVAKTFCAQGDIVAAIPGPPAAAPGAWQFSGQAMNTILGNLAYVALGAMCRLQAVQPGWWRRPTIPAMAKGLSGLIPMGRGELPSLRIGIALFPILAAANLALLWVTGEPIATAGRDPYYRNMGAYHAVLIALAAGVGEEVVYRGVIQQGLLRLFGGRRPTLLAFGGAVMATSLLFAYAHAGFGNAPLLLFAFLFSLLAGLVAQRLGIWAAIALHSLIDFYAFARNAVVWDAAMWVTVGLVTAAVVAVTAMQVKAWRKGLATR
jgi:membrane protease YdiL (CAAX protease family)